MSRLLIIAAILMYGCKGEKCDKIILSKSYNTYMDNPMRDGLCRFFYREYENGTLLEFNDSCYKYNVGDTIKPTSHE